MSRKISQLNESLTIDGSEYIPISKTSLSLKITLNKIKSLFTKADVGLSNVDNTSDLDKPLSNASIQALNTKADTGHSHSISQIASLEATLNNKANVSHSHTVDSVTGLQGLLDTKAPTNHIHVTSQISGLDQTLAGKAPLAHSHNVDEVSGLQTSLNNINSRIDALDLTGAVDSVNGKTGNVTLTKTDIGLGNVDNTSDLAKPISTATQTALDGKSAIGHTHTKAEIGLGNVDDTADIDKPLSTIQKQYVDNAVTVVAGQIQW